MNFKNLIFRIFIASTFYILLVELILKNYIAINETCFRLGEFFLQFAYSLAASSIFYFVAVYLPGEYQKRKIFQSMYRRTNHINDLIAPLFFNYLKIEMNNDNYSEIVKKIDIRVKEIKCDEPVDDFNDWHEYLYNLNYHIAETIKRITVYHQFLDKEYFTEITLLEDCLITDIRTFAGYKALECKNLSYASFTFVEIYVHNDILQRINMELYKKHEAGILKDAKIYRQKFYKET